MGKQSDLQSLTLLGMINSSLITLFKADMVEPLKPTIAYGVERLDQMIREFPIKWNENERWWDEVLRQINDRINVDDGILYSAHAVTFFVVIICTDLLEELTDPVKRGLVSEALEILMAVDNHLDPAGDQFETYAEIEALTQDIYKVVGFSKEGRYDKHLRKLQRRAQRNGRL